jgi:hypothetical protein
MNIHFSHRITAAPKTQVPCQPNWLRQCLGRRSCAAWIPPLLLLLLLALPSAVQAQFNYETNDGTIASETNGLLVTTIGNDVSYFCYSLPTVMLPAASLPSEL